jgi:hypothetical protein
MGQPSKARSKMRPRRAILAACLASVLLFAGCAFESPIPASAIPTASGSALRLRTDSTNYGVNSPVGVTVVNAGQTSYYSIDGRSACTFLQVQRYDSDQQQWLSVDGCTPSGQPRVLLIAPGAREPFTLAPASASDANSWQSGLYRIALTYSTNSDGATSAQTAYSAGFVIS